MKPDYLVTVNDNDITENIKKYLLSVSVTDETGLESDTAELRISNPGQNLAVPETGQKIIIWLGFTGENLIKTGTYIIDECELQGRPNIMILRARATNFIRAGMKENITQSWDNVTITDIIQSIASKNGLNPAVSASLANIKIDHIDQVRESNINFLTRLAKDNGAFAKIVDNNLVFFRDGEYKTVTDKNIPTHTIDRTSIIAWSVSFVDRNKYDAVIAEWHNVDTAKVENVIVGPVVSNVTYTLKKRFTDKKSAEIAASAKLDELKRGTVTGNVKITGNALYTAESKIKLPELHEEIDSAVFRIRKATHTLNNRGYITSLDIETVQSDT